MIPVHTFPSPFAPSAVLHIRESLRQRVTCEDLPISPCFVLYPCVRFLALYCIAESDLGLWMLLGIDN